MIDANRLHPGDSAPDFRVMAAKAGEIVQLDLAMLLSENRGLVLTSYVLDFTGG